MDKGGWGWVNESDREKRGVLEGGNVHREPLNNFLETPDVLLPKTLQNYPGGLQRLTGGGGSAQN